MSEPGRHVLPVRVYAAVFVTLVVLTAVTTAVAFVDLGRVNVVIMLAIAVVKATLVILYFMHVRYSPRLTWIVVGGSFGWLAVLIALTTGDVVARFLVPASLSELAHPAPSAFGSGPPRP